MSMMYTLSHINDMLEYDPVQFVAECDDIFRERITHTADMICENISTSPIVLLSGPSGSGKTTTAKRVEDELERRGIVTHTISMDNYFKTINLATAPRTPEGELDFESPECVDMDLLNEHFSMLASGETIHVPIFMFTRQKRSASQYVPMKLGENEIAIFEGIHAMNDSITDVHPEAFKLYISAASGILDDDGNVFFPGEWMRLTRRAVRDSKFRGAGAEFTLGLWNNVLRGEQLYINPFRHKADIELDSSLSYEVSVLKAYAEPLFDAVTKENLRFDEITHIQEAFQKFRLLDSKYVQPDSLLREFIGGGIYKY